MTHTAQLLYEIETCTLPDFTRVFYARVNRVEVRDDIPATSGTLHLTDDDRFNIGVCRKDECFRLLVFTHIVLYIPFVICGHLEIDAGELPFFLPHDGNGVAGRFVNQYHSEVSRLFNSKIQ